MAAINAMKPPLSLSSRLRDVPHVLPVPSDKFFATPGVGVVRQSSEVPRSSRPLATDSPVTRKSFAQELEVLRQTPLEALRSTQQPAPVVSAAGVPVVRSLMPMDSSSENATAATMARIAARATASRTSSPMRQKSTVVPELERLRQQIQSTSRAFAPAGRQLVDSADKAPISRGRSPATRSSPARRASPVIFSTVERTGSTPGPGAYYKQSDFNQRSFLSTPPRRRP
jgi:hypothetical protein